MFPFAQLCQPEVSCCCCSAKSTAAAKAAEAINSSLKVKALQNRVSPATEDVFNDKFWGSLDVVVNALDNVSARLYVDSRCVYFGKPLLESGTLGPKCNTQVVMPSLTENYGEPSSSLLTTFLKMTVSAAMICDSCCCIPEVLLALLGLGMGLKDISFVCKGCGW